MRPQTRGYSLETGQNWKEEAPDLGVSQADQTAPCRLVDLPEPRAAAGSAPGTALPHSSPVPGEPAHCAGGGGNGRTRGRSQSRPAPLACSPASGHVTEVQVSTASGVGRLDRCWLPLLLARVRGRLWRPPRSRQPPHRRQQGALARDSASLPKPRRSISCSRR
jgi:hypothetical protein